MILEVEKEKVAVHLMAKVRDPIHPLMGVEFPVDIVKDLPRSYTISRGEDGLSIERILIDPLDSLRTHEKRIKPILDSILGVTVPRGDQSEVFDKSLVPILRNHPNIGPFVARTHSHENPIFSRWLFTLASNPATRSTISGRGVS